MKTRISYRRIVAFTVVATACISVAAQEIAQDAKPIPKAEQKIRDALNGDAALPTGDGMLDDVIDIVRRRGSILDGSVLDEPELAEVPSLPANRDRCHQRPIHWSSHP